MALGVIIRREFFQLAHSAHGLGPLFLALAASGAGLMWLLQHAEGSPETLPALWALTAAAGLPFLASVAASRGFTRDREGGMMRLMFATPVRSRAWVWGKVWAAWALCMVYVGGLSVAAWALLRWLLPSTAQVPWSWPGFLFAGGALAVQALFWSALGTLVSLFSRSSASTFLLSLLACALVPPAMCQAGLWLTPGAEVQWPWFPLQAMVYDCAFGLIDLRLLGGCLLMAGVFVYAAGIVFDALRLCATER